MIYPGADGRLKLIQPSVTPFFLFFCEAFWTRGTKTKWRFQRHSALRSSPDGRVTDSDCSTAPELLCYKIRGRVRPLTVVIGCNSSSRYNSRHSHDRGRDPTQEKYMLPRVAQLQPAFHHQATVMWTVPHTLRSRLKHDVLGPNLDVLLLLLLLLPPLLLRPAGSASTATAL